MSVSEAAVSVLVVDDTPGLAELIATCLEREGQHLSAIPATDGTEASQLFAEDRPDAVVSDFDMPGMDGLELLDVIRDLDPTLPFILYTGKGSEEIASEAISRGVTEYMQKETGTEQYSVLFHRISNAVQQSRAEEFAEVQQDRFKAVFEHASDAMIIADDDGHYIDVNGATSDLFGRSKAELLGKKAADFSVENFDFDAAWDSFRNSKSERGLFPVRRPDGEIRIAEYVANSDIRTGEHLSILRDVTEQLDAEKRTQTVR